MADADKKLMTQKEIDDFWARAERAVKEVRAWPAWRTGAQPPETNAWSRCNRCSQPVEEPIQVDEEKVCSECEARALWAYVRRLALLRTPATDEIWMAARRVLLDWHSGLLKGPDGAMEHLAELDEALKLPEEP